MQIQNTPVGETVTGGILASAPWWGSVLHDINAIAGTIVTVLGAVMAVHGVWRIIHGLFKGRDQNGGRQ